MSYEILSRNTCINRFRTRAIVLESRNDFGDLSISSSVLKSVSDTSSPDSASSVAISVDDSSSSSSNDSNDSDSAELNSDPPSLGGYLALGEIWDPCQL